MLRLNHYYDTILCHENYLKFCYNITCSSNTPSFHCIRNCRLSKQWLQKYSVCQSPSFHMGRVVNDNRFVLSRKLFCKCPIEYFSIPPSSIELRSLIRHEILVFVFFIHWRFVLPSSVHALIHYVPEEASAHVNG